MKVKITKLLTPEEIDFDTFRLRVLANLYMDRQNATIKAACEKIAQLEKCPVSNCVDGYVPVDMASGCGEPCFNCKEHPGFAHKDWKGALRSLNK